MNIGYARVSTTDQNLARQLEAFEKAGVEKVFSEKLTGKNDQRPQLQEMLNYIRDKDVVTVMELERLGRNSRDLTEIMEKIRSKGAVLNILDLPSFAGVEDPNLRALLTNLVIDIYKYNAEEERKKILRRQREGIRLAKAQGRYPGKKREYGPNVHDKRKRFIYNEIVKMLQEEIPVARISRKVGLSRMQVYRIKKYATEDKELRVNIENGG